MRFFTCSVLLVASGLAVVACGRDEYGTSDASSGGMAGSGSGGSNETGGTGAMGGDTGTGGGAEGGDTGTGGGTVNNTGGATSAPELPVSDGLMLWLKADAGVASVDGIVSSWEDQSKYGQSASQSDAGMRPLLVADGLNGKPTIRFDGVDDFFDLPSGTVDLTAGVSFFVVAQEAPTKDVNCTAYVEFSNGSEIQDIHFGQWQYKLLYEVTDTWVQAITTLPVDTPQVLSAVHRSNDTVEIRKDSEPIGLSTFHTPETLERVQNYVGKSLYGNCMTFSGKISEILMYGRGVSKEEATQIEAYLSDRWL